MTRRTSWLRSLWLAGLLGFAFLPGGDPLATAPQTGFEPPSAEAWAGRDRLGRDVFARTRYAVRASLVRVALAEALSVGAATASAGLVVLLVFRLPLWAAVLRACLLSIRVVPPFLAALGLAVLLRRTPWGLVLALAVISYAYSVTVFEAEFLAASRMPQLDAARSLGAGWSWSVGRYLVPSAGPQLLRYVGLDVASLVAYEALFGFVGLTYPPLPALGEMLLDARAYLFDYPWLFLAPALALTAMLLSAWQVRWGVPEWR